MKKFFKHTSAGHEELTRYSLQEFRLILQFLEDGDEAGVSGWDYAVERDGEVKYLAELTEAQRAELHRDVMEEMTFKVITPAVYQHGSDIDVGRKHLDDDSAFLADVEHHLSMEGMKGAIQKVYTQGIQLTSYGWRWVAGVKTQPYSLQWVGLLAYYTELSVEELPDLSKTPMIAKLVALLRDELKWVEPVWE